MTAPRPQVVAWNQASRTKWTRRVPHPVLIGHAASLSQVVAWNQAFCECERPQSAPLLASLDSPFAFLLLSATQTWALALELRGPLPTHPPTASRTVL